MSDFPSVERLWDEEADETVAEDDEYAGVSHYDIESLCPWDEDTILIDEETPQGEAFMQAYRVSNNINKRRNEAAAAYNEKVLAIRDIQAKRADGTADASHIERLHQAVEEKASLRLTLDDLTSQLKAAENSRKIAWRQYLKVWDEKKKTESAATEQVSGETSDNANESNNVQPSSLSDLIKRRFSTRRYNYTNECDDEEVRTFITTKPKAAKSCTVEELTRLLQCKQTSVDTIRLIHDTCESDIFEKLHSQCLGFLAARPEKSDLACYLIDVNPSLIEPSRAEMPAGETFVTPLHYACLLGTLDIVKKICNVDSRVIYIEDGIYCQNAFHWLCSHHFENEDASLRLIRYLAEKEPKILLTPESRFGETPLSTAVGFGASERALSLLLKLQPEAAKVKCKDGCLPLSDCLSNDHAVYSRSIVSSLIAAYPRAVKLKDRHSRTSLHSLFLSRKQCRTELVDLLLETSPGVVKLADKNGDLPLHYSLREGHKFVPIECVEQLIKAYPEAVSLVNKFGQAPLHILCEKSFGRVDILKLLLERSTMPLDIRTKARQHVSFAVHRSGIHHIVLNSSPLEVASTRLAAALEHMQLVSTRSGSHPLQEDLALSSRNQDDNNQENDFLRILRAFDSIGNCEENANDEDVISVLDTFHQVRWSGGIALLLDTYPQIMNAVFTHTAAVPTLLSLVGKRCSLSTLYSVLKGNPSGIERAAVNYPDEDDVSPRANKKQKV